MLKNGHKLIFEGAELVGKSSIIHPVYDFLEKKYNTEPNILDGCHWFNSDVGIFGTKYGKKIVEKYTEMAELMLEKNVIFEKLHISDQVYNKFYSKNLKINYEEVEERLLKIGAKIIFCFVDEDQDIFESRLDDRLSLYDHYGRISQKPETYLELQEDYKEKIKSSGLPILEVNLTKLPNPEAVKQILNWIGEED